MQDIANTQTVEQRRLAWRCRRGMLELDIVLQRFVSQQFNTLNADELQAFDTMLDLPDNEFWQLLSQAEETHKNAATQALLCKMRII